MNIIFIVATVIYLATVMFFILKDKKLKSEKKITEERVGHLVEVVEMKNKMLKKEPIIVENIKHIVIKQFDEDSVEYLGEINSILTRPQFLWFLHQYREFLVTNILNVKREDREVAAGALGGFDNMVNRMKLISMSYIQKSGRNEI